MLKELVKVANRLDHLGLTKEADIIDAIIKSSSETFNSDDHSFSVQKEPPIEEEDIIKAIQAKNSDIEVLSADWEVVMDYGFPEAGYQVSYSYNDEVHTADCRVVEYETDMPLLGRDNKIYFLYCEF